MEELGLEKEFRPLRLTPPARPQPVRLDAAPAPVDGGIQRVQEGVRPVNPIASLLTPQPARSIPPLSPPASTPPPPPQPLTLSVSSPPAPVPLSPAPSPAPTPSQSGSLELPDSSRQEDRPPMRLTGRVAGPPAPFTKTLTINRFGNPAAPSSDAFNRDLEKPNRPQPKRGVLLFSEL